jgi:hypothetical protein
MKLIPYISLLALISTVTAQQTQVPLFTNPVSYPAPGASMAAVADVNGDGILDIVTANGYAGNQFLAGGQGVSVLLGNGDGTFQAVRSVSTIGNPSFVAVGDFNNDGKQDIAVGSGIGPIGTVSILFGNGDGTFQAPIDTATGGATGLAVADFNGDGKLDLAVTSGVNGMVLLGRGDGTFTISYTTPTHATKVQAVDVNGDGILDVVFSGIIGAVKLGNGDGTFRDGQANLQAFSGAFAVVGDFNGDGRPDLAIRYSASRGGSPGVSALLLGQPDGTFGPQFFTNFTAGVSNIVTADFNGDGILDTGGAGGLNPFDGVSFGNGDGRFTFASVAFGVHPPNLTPGALQVPPPFAAVGDFDRNGSPDMVVADGNTIEVGLNTGGHPPLLAQLSLLAPAVFGGGNTVPAAIATSVVGGATPLTGQVFLGGPASAAGAVITLSSSDPTAFFPGGNTVTIPVGAQSASFSISTSGVAASTPVTISASSGLITVSEQLTVIPPFTFTSLSAGQPSIFGLIGGNAAVGTVTLSGPAADGVVITLTSSNSAAVTIPASVSVAPGATSASFPLSASFVTADTPVVLSGSFQGITQSATVTVRKEAATVVITKSQYTVSKSQLNVEATSTSGVSSLQVFNAATHAFVGSIPTVGGGKYVGQFSVVGPFTSVAVQSSVGGLAVAPVPQK